MSPVFSTISYTCLYLSLMRKIEMNKHKKPEISNKMCKHQMLSDLRATLVCMEILQKLKFICVNVSEVIISWKSLELISIIYSNVC